MKHNVLTNISCTTSSATEPLEDGVYYSSSNTLYNLGQLRTGTYQWNETDRTFHPYTPPDHRLPDGVYVSSGGSTTSVDDGLYRVIKGGLSTYQPLCPPTPPIVTRSHDDLVLAALIGSFVGNALEKNTERLPTDMIEEGYLVDKEQS